MSQAASSQIDIVIPWVDSGDPEWRKEKNLYAGKVNDGEDSSDMRFRDWDNLQYVFRSIEKHAPWVRRVHFITYGHLPGWLDTECEKLHIVRHSDYIPAEYLPVFSSHVIELNMNRIPGLAEQFIYFNDDIFLLQDVRPEDFFRDGLPCDCMSPTLIVPSFGFSSISFNCAAGVNEHFSKRKLIREHPGKWFSITSGAGGVLRSLFFLPWRDHTGFKNHHMAVPYLKRTLDEVWEQEGDLLRETCSHRFRNFNDVNQYIFRYWQFAKGEFNPVPPFGKVFRARSKKDEIIRYIRSQKGKMICINDEQGEGLDEAMKQINAVLQEQFPEKSSFEQ